MGESSKKIVYDEVEEFLLEKMPSMDQFMEVLGRLYINGFEICFFYQREQYLLTISDNTILKKN